MGLFSSKEERYVGVDIGAGGVKLVELLFENGKYKLMTYGSTLRTIDVVDTPLTDKVSDASKHLKTLMKEAGVVGRAVVASLPVYSVFSSIIAIPRVRDQNETRMLVERQAVKLMPMSLSEMVIDFQVLENQKTASKNKLEKVVVGAERKVLASTVADENVRVLITGASKETVKTYTGIFQSSGLDLLSLETEPFAIIRSLVGEDRSPIMILDVGAFRTNMTIVEQGVPFLNRSIKVGGAGVTKRIAEQTGVSLDEAEQVKHDMHLSNDGVTVPKAVVDLFNPIVNEIAYAMELFAKSELHDSEKIEKVLLTGGSALLPGLDVFLTEKLNVRTFVGDPWARVQVNEALRPVLDEIGPKYAVAIGLAMHPKKKE